MVLGFVVSAGVERIVVRPIEHRNPGAVIVALIGVFLGVNQLVAMIWGVDARSLPSVFPDDADDFVTILGAPVRIARLGLIGVLIVVLFLLWLLFNKTKIGLAMRAVANNQESSNLVGIRVGTVLLLGWGLAGAIGVLAAAMLAPSAGLTGTLMLGPFLLASVAAVLGGLDSPVGAVVGGLIIGLIEAFIVGYVDVPRRRHVVPGDARDPAGGPAVAAVGPVRHPSEWSACDGAAASGSPKAVGRTGPVASCCSAASGCSCTVPSPSGVDPGSDCSPTR